MDSITLTIIIMGLVGFFIVAWSVRTINAQVNGLPDMAARRGCKLQLAGYGILGIVSLYGAFQQIHVWPMMVAVGLILHTLLFIRDRYVVVSRWGVPVEGWSAGLTRLMQIALGLLFVAIYYQS